MKVFIIKFKKVNSNRDEWFIWNVYSSKEKAIQVYNRLSDSLDTLYMLCEYNVID